METTSPSEQISPVSRRTFLRFLMAFSVMATLGGVLAPIVGYLWPSRRQATGQHARVRAASLAELEVARGLVTSAENKPIVLTYQDQGVKAFSAICTHLGCVVQWKGDAGFIQCPCHDARFNPQTGAVISGPAPSPLPPYPTEIDGDDIYVSV